MTKHPSKYFLHFSRQELLKLGFDNWRAIIEHGGGDTKRLGELIRILNNPPSKLAKFSWKNAKWVSANYAFKTKKVLNIDTAEEFVKHLKEYIKLYPTEIDPGHLQDFYEDLNDFKYKNEIIEMVSILVKSISTFVVKNPQVVYTCTLEEETQKAMEEIMKAAVDETRSEGCESCQDEHEDAHLSREITKQQRFYLV